MKTPRSMKVGFWGNYARPGKAMLRKARVGEKAPRVRTVSRLRLAAIFAEFRAKNRRTPSRILA